jgi:hypothetical protein
LVVSNQQTLPVKNVNCLPVFKEIMTMCFQRLPEQRYSRLQTGHCNLILLCLPRPDFKVICKILAKVQEEMAVELDADNEEEVRQQPLRESTYEGVQFD